MDNQTFILAAAAARAVLPFLRHLDHCAWLVDGATPCTCGATEADTALRDVVSDGAGRWREDCDGYYDTDCAIPA